jgi:hypothetical protein
MKSNPMHSHTTIYHILSKGSPAQQCLDGFLRACDIDHLLCSVQSCRHLAQRSYLQEKNWPGNDRIRRPVLERANHPIQCSKCFRFTAWISRGSRNTQEDTAWQRHFKIFEDHQIISNSSRIRQFLLYPFLPQCFRGAKECSIKPILPHWAMVWPSEAKRIQMGHTCGPYHPIPGLSGFQYRHLLSGPSSPKRAWNRFGALMGLDSDLNIFQLSV